MTLRIFRATNLTKPLFTPKFVRTMATAPVSYLKQKEAAEIDERLFGDYGYSVHALMELAGQAVALAAAQMLTQPSARLLVLSGPGNNGGDGLVAARHLKLFGHEVSVLYPKESRNELMKNLVKQAQGVGVLFLEDLGSAQSLQSHYDLGIDALFGFSFQPPIREPFGEIIGRLADSALPLLSVDIPSGWDVEAGPPSSEPVLRPAALISLTAPKLCARQFSGTHFLGGRFLPPALARDYNLTLPPYPNSDYIQRL